MTKSSSIDKRTALKGLAALGVGGVAALLSSKSSGQDPVTGAASDGALAAIFAKWAKEWNDNATTVNGYISDAKGHLSDLEVIANAGEEVRNAIVKVNVFTDKLTRFAKDPLGGFVPTIDTNSISWKSYDKAKEYYNKLLVAKKTEPDSVQGRKVRRLKRAEAGYTMGKAELIQLREMSEAQRANHSNMDLTKTGKSHAQKYTEEAGPLQTAILLNIAESTIRQESMIVDIHKEYVSKVPIKTDFSDKSVDKTLKDYRKGKGTLIEDE